MPWLNIEILEIYKKVVFKINTHNLESYLELVKPLNSKAMEDSQKRWDSLAKPLNSLGELEKMIVKISGMVGTSEVDLSKKCAVVLCADNGIIAENVTQTGNEVTYTVAKNVSQGCANVNFMASVSNADVFSVDIGMVADIEDGYEILDRKVSHGTKNFLETSAMTMDETLKAIEVGINLVEELKIKGYKVIATGEMGIGNTTTSSALASVLLNLPVETVTGKGAGLSDGGLKNKVEVIKKGISLRQPNPEDPLDVLSKLGGLDICGMVGLYIGGAIHRMPIVIDGLISAVSALISARICPETVGYMLPSHMSTEPATVKIMDELGLSPTIHAGMHLGEGTGAVALFPLLDMAMKVYDSDRTFNSIGMEAYQKL